MWLVAVAIGAAERTEKKSRQSAFGRHRPEPVFARHLAKKIRFG